MRSRRLGRFVVEVAFLGGLAALAASAHMRAGAVIAVMAFGWVVVALLEWASWLDRPHFGRGLPPRYYVPQFSLPPPQTPRPAGTPLGARRLGADDAQTAIAAPGSWPAALDEWPVLDLEALGEDTVVGAPPEAGSEPESGEDTVVVSPPAAEQQAGGAAAPEPARPGPDAQAVAPASAEPARPGARARHRIDPFAGSGSGSRRRRREEDGSVELPARPPAGRALPAWLDRSETAGER